MVPTTGTRPGSTSNRFVVSYVLSLYWNAFVENPGFESYDFDIVEIKKDDYKSQTSVY